MRMKSLVNTLGASALMVLLAACSSIGIGISLPIGGIGSIGVGVDSRGRATGGVAVGTGGVSVGVGGTAELPRAAPAPQSPASAASSAN